MPCAVGAGMLEYSHSTPYKAPAEWENHDFREVFEMPRLFAAYLKEPLDPPKPTATWFRGCGTFRGGCEAL
jgi:hypothetical protein